MAKQKQIVRIQCDIKGYEDFWISYDVSDWGIDVFVDLPYRGVAWVLRNFIPQHCVNWHLVSDDGEAIVRPQMGAPEEVWLEVWKALGPKTGRAIYRWLGMSALEATGEAMDLDFKSEAPDPGESDGADGVADG